MAFSFTPQLDLNLESYRTPDSSYHNTSSGTSHTLHNMSGSSSAKMAAIPEVEIDGSGRFKYVLLKLWAPDHKDEEDFKYLVRGNNDAEWHNDIFEDMHSRVSPLGLEVECVGGGRILHEPSNKKIYVYGYSQGFGRAKHSVSCELLKKKYPHYTDITWSDEGY